MFGSHDQGRSAESTAGKALVALLGVIAMASDRRRAERRARADVGRRRRRRRRLLGGSVAIDGDTIVAGAPGDNGGEGAVYVFAAPATVAADAPS